MRSWKFLSTLCLIGLILVSCAHADEENRSGDRVQRAVESNQATFDLYRVLDNFEHPWAVDWLPDGRMLITERPGRILLVDDEGRRSLGGVPEVHARGQGGMLDVAVPPDHAETGWIYLTYSVAGSGGAGTALARAKLEDGRLTDVEELYRQTPLVQSGRHFGSRIVFPADGTVVFNIGERGQREPAQDLSNSIGKTLRLNRDGSIPEDNPFVDREDALDEIYSYGHRNPQGMAIHPETGVIWQHEHGPNGGDELNILRPGANYGWPEDTYGTEYTDDSPIGMLPHENPDSVDPVVHWSPTSIAPSGMAFYTGDRFDEWRGDIFLGALADRHLRRLELDGEDVVDQEELLAGTIGRIRAVETGPDGYLYLLTDAPSGGLYRLQPADD